MDRLWEHRYKGRSHGWATRRWADNGKGADATRPVTAESGPVLVRGVDEDTPPTLP